MKMCDLLEADNGEWLVWVPSKHGICFGPGGSREEAIGDALSYCDELAKELREEYVKVT